jgi:hypothetical protein
MKTLTKSSLIVCVVISLMLTACGTSTPVATPTASFTNTSIPPTPTPTITLTPTETPTPTATPNFAATKQYENFFPIVQKLYDDGVISTLNGNYQMMGDYSDQSTAAGTFRWDLYDNKVGEFIIRADIKLETAPAPASQSGCGFVFGFGAINSQEFTFLQRNGSAIYGLGGRPFTTKYYDKLQNPAEFTLTVVTYKDDIRVFVNDKEVIKMNLDLNRDSNKGKWGPALLSGSTQEFGTRCDFKNIELWEINDG